MSRNILYTINQYDYYDSPVAERDYGAENLESEKEYDMFVKDITIAKVTNGFVLNTTLEMTEEEYKKAKAEAKKAGDTCGCIGPQKSEISVFTTLDDVIIHLKETWGK